MAAMPSSDAGSTLRQLCFAADQAFASATGAGPEGSLYTAQTSLLQLHSLLSVTAAGGPASRHQADALLQQCTSRLHKLTVQRSDGRHTRVPELLKQAGCPEGFRFSNPEGFDLAAKLRQSEPHKSLLAGALPSRRVQLQRPPAVPPAAPQPPPGVLAEQPVNQAGGQPQQRRSGFQVPVKQGQGGHGSGGGNAGCAGFDPHHRHQPQQGQQAGQQHGQAPYPFQPPCPPAARQGGPPQHPPPGADSRWASNKLARRAQDAHVHQSRQGGQGWGRSGPSGDEEVNLASSSDDGGGEVGEGGHGAGIPGFQTAKSKLIAEMRKNGQQYYGGGGPGGGGGGGPPPRQGLVRPGPPGGGGAGGGSGLGAGGKFVPPYLRKAIEAQIGGGGGSEGEPEGPLSLRTLEILRLEPGEPLPEPLAKLDPLLIENVCNEVMDSGGQLDWDDIAGQQTAKDLIQEVVVWPIKNPQLFTGARAPPKGILLFGPPGTGKTMLGKAIATNISAVFFSISASSLVSKWMGEGEKLVCAWLECACHLCDSTTCRAEAALQCNTAAVKCRCLSCTSRLCAACLLVLPGLAAVPGRHACVPFCSVPQIFLCPHVPCPAQCQVRALFAVAAHVAPSVIFIDEVDSLLSARKSDGEHESMRRLKTEILIQMEGIDPSRADRRVLLIGATNRPEELDEAARRRMPKQLYIPLPCADARRDLILRQLGPGGPIRAELSEDDLRKVVARTEGYSGSDMKMLIQEACQGPVRDAFKANGAALAGLTADELRPVVLRDFQMAARAQKASVEPVEIERYERYNEKHGAKLAGAGGPEEEEEEEW
ncbi:hypothetical protein ABPG75_000570 [Micractinium tetrahymenae]